MCVYGIVAVWIRSAFDMSLSGKIGVRGSSCNLFGMGSSVFVGIRRESDQM